MNPQSKLTMHRPQLWAEALTMATAITGMVYVDKLPAADGAISACGGWAPPASHTNDPEWSEWRDKERTTPHGQAERYVYERKKTDRGRVIDGEDRARGVKRRIAELQERIDDYDERIRNEDDDEIGDALRKDRDKLIREKASWDEEKAGWDKWEKDKTGDGPERPDRSGYLTAPVPPGAVEWILHEVGHYVAATEGERLLPDYGLGASLTGRDADREWAAWAFEEIVLSPFGPARLIAPPDHRSGVGFTRDRIPEWAMRRAHVGLIELDVDLAGLRDLSSRWLRWATRERQVSENGLDMAAIEGAA